MMERCLSIITMVFVCFYSPLCAAEVREESAKPILDNIGFMKNPPKDLQEKFPMCDAFLQVEWIDKEKKIGYINYESIMKGEKKTVWALVTLYNQWPNYTWDIYKYKRQDRLKELFEMIKYGEDKGNLGVMIPTYKGKSATIYSLGTTEDSIANHRLTVCIPYPDEKRAWIVEGKSVKQTYSEGQREALSNTIKEQGQKFSNSWIESLWVLDINFDGKDDFVFKTSIVASFSKKLFHSIRITEDADFKQTFPPNSHTCHISTNGNYPLTTDGKNYYISNQCNITELTSFTEKE